MSLRLYKSGDIYLKLRCALMAITIMALSLAVKAQPVRGPYIGGGAGILIMQEENTTLTSRVSAGHGQMMTGPGPAASLSLGYGFGNGLRAEVEGSFRYKNFSANDRASTVSGIDQKYGPMVNLLYDVVGIVPLVQPYVGVGVGYQWASESHLQVNHPGVVFRGNDDTKGDFAYQAIVGAALPIPGIPRLSLTADYRFMGLAGGRAYGGTLTTGRARLPANVTVDSDYSHTVLIGFRYAFGGPAAQ
jgi:OOP family OmpA-OmpF porin